jgi:hypothetical protein
LPRDVAGEQNRNALGLEDRRSKCVEEAWRILTLLSEWQARPPGYTFEMVDARDHPSAKAREGFTTFVQMAAGDSKGFVAVDAAKLGSPAHRVRVFCTNLAPVAGIRERYEAYDREWSMDRKEAQDCLDSGRMVNIARFNDPQVGAFYPMNVAGRPIRVFPTLVATEESYAFRRDEEGRPGQGMVYDRQLRGWVEPNNDERERIMGLPAGSTITPGQQVSRAERHIAIGGAIEIRPYTWFCKEILRWRALGPRDLM